MRERWQLDPRVTYLNHGSYGATPTVVLQAQDEWRARLERDPMGFFHRELPRALREARQALAAFVGAQADDLAFLPNATTGVSTVLASLALAPGDELLITNHGYNACKNALAVTAERTGAKRVVADVPFPIQRSQQVTDAVLAAVTPKTKLVLLDHVTSPSALIFPVAEITRTLEARGIAVLIDGAHAPGMVPVQIDALGASFYTANCHKWMCAPKGAAFLWVRRDLQHKVHPLVTSHGAGSGFRNEFDWTGTADPSAFLSVPAAIAAFDWPQTMAANHALALQARALLSASPVCPDDMVGAMATVLLPPLQSLQTTPLELDPLSEALYRAHHIEVPVFAFPRPGDRCLRVSAQRYNDIEEYRRLSMLLPTLA